jgi:hypothetical protein
VTSVQCSGLAHKLQSPACVPGGPICPCYCT